jgi:PPK2 family polyphosphate:nucleotide phosphotransferase
LGYVASYNRPATDPAEGAPAISHRPDLRDALRVKPGRSVRLERLDPGATDGHDRPSAELATQRELVRLRDLQDRLWAEAARAVLVVLQGIDAAGKDGTISKVMEAFNPQGCPVTSFKVPSTEDLAHDYLWRVHQHVPKHGEIGIFNRSHYEAVMVERVHGLVPKRVWSRRYAQINDFERLLSENGTTVVKFFLQIDRDEQRQRLQARYDDPTKRWKFAMGDLDERKLWDDYQRAFDEALTETSTESAPWYVIPANHKWFRDLAVSTILADALADLKPAYPPEPDLPKGLVIQ